MFGRSKNKEALGNGAKKISVSTIPVEFYAGANPVIKFRSVEKLVGGNISTSPRPEKKVAAGEHPKVSSIGFLIQRRFLILGAVGIFILFVIGAGIYYWRLSVRGTAVKPPPPRPPVTQVPPPVTISPVPEASTSTEGTTTTTVAQPEALIPPVSLSGGLIEFPSALLGDSADMDKDGLTDVEEELFATDPGKPDTDDDSYNDGTEIYYLYSPTGFAPERLSATAAIKEFQNPIFSYKLFYPSSWAIGNVDLGYREMLFSTLSGENIEIRVFDRAAGQTLEDWFTANAPGEQIGALVDFNTVYGSLNYMRNDKLVYYFMDAGHIYAIVYHVTNSNTVNYRSVIQMMARSFRTAIESEAVLPNQEVVLPQSTIEESTSTATTSAEF